jgi:ribonuclease-3
VERADRLAERLGLPVRDRNLLAQALTHSSWLHEHPGEAVGHNERLELLGDAVVNLAISQALFERHPDEDEGHLSARRAAIVSAGGLAELAERIDLAPELALGEGESERPPYRPALLAAAFEALAGALFLDAGWEATRDWIVALAAPELDAGVAPELLKSPKSRLQEETQRVGLRPVYRLLDASGPDHDKVFRVEVVVDDEVLGLGTGSSRRIAETVAAAEAVAALESRAAAAAADGGAAAEPPVGGPRGSR